MLDNESLNILLIEDDEDDFFIAQRLLSRAVDVDLEWINTFDEGLAACLEHRHDIILVDYRLGARTGLDLLEDAISQGCDTPIILLTGQGAREIDLQAMEAGAVDYLVKWEFDAHTLERSIRYARERKRAEEQIREQAALLDKARDAISAFDLDHRAIYWNKSAERLTGFSAEEALGERIESVLFEEDSQKAHEVLAAVHEHGEWDGELHQKTKNGHELIVESRWTLVRDSLGHPRSILVINTDVTERKQMETQVLRGQRMESIGRLVSGIAHDLGNLLVPLLLGIKVLQQRYADDERAMRTLSMMQQSGERGSNMVKQVLAFARGVQGDRVPLRPELVVREVEKMAQETFPGNIDVQVDIADDLYLVKGDATQLQQVLMNLCVNARDAMPQGGTLAIQVKNLTIDETMARTNLEARPGKYVKLTVSDTGEGIPPEVLDKVFEPFFTTKPVGKGTGLGLSTVYSILKSHDGFASVNSQVGQGTTFNVFLPASVDAEIPDEPDNTRSVRDGHNELILLVDDEAFIRETGQEILENAGYRVVTAAHGKAALDLCDEQADDLAVVITDIMMPEMDGIALIHALRRHHPHLPIIAASGMADSQSQAALDAGAQTFLSKPFTADVLYAALDDVLADESV